MIIRDYIYTDYLLMNRRPEQEWIPSSWNISHYEYAQLISKLNSPKTVIIEDKIVLVGGIGFNSGWAGEAGFILSTEFNDLFKVYGKRIIKEVKNYLDNTLFSMVYSGIDPDIKGAEKLAKLLGFKFSGNITTTKDMKLYLRTNNNG